ncbi:MAG: carboxylesterase family protein [Lachnospiraceae bacterium]|nr:carboxylesterase family protein [Lachnospiraceae bacterium]
MMKEKYSVRSDMLAKYGKNRRLSSVPEAVPSVQCENGIFIGKTLGGVTSYKGVPYAKPPVGLRRWKRAKAADKSEEIFEAYYNAKSPIQTEWETEVASFYPQGEDCLYLNVWVSEEDKTERKPVMVFFHGGSYGWGGTADPLYDGHNLVASHKDIILVTVGYRTGIMGFVDFSSVPGGEEYKDAPNLGLLDQIEALRWIRSNIVFFGGDRDNVTIFGESAGGGSVSLMPVIQEAKGLFKRVIAQSGNVALTFSKKECEFFTKKLLKESGCSDMKELQALSEDQLKKVNEKLNFYNNFPERDGRIIPEDPYIPYLEGETSGIDMMIGTNKNETNYWVGELGGIVPYMMTAPLKYENDIKGLDRPDLKRVEEFIKIVKQRCKRMVWCRTEFYNELLFRLPSIRQAEGHSKNGGHTYMYYWTEPSTIKYRGACHAVELSYVFGNTEETIYTGSPADKKLSELVGDMWVNFARSGNPGTNKLSWPEYDVSERKTMVIGRKSRVVSDPLKKERELLFPLLDHWISPSYAILNMNVPYVRKLGIGAALTLSGVAGAFVLLYKAIRRDRL